MKKVIYLLFGFFLVILSESLVFAYTPSSYFIVKSWVDLNQKSKQQAFKITSRVTLPNQSGANASAESSFKEVLIYFPKSESMKSWALDESGQILYHKEYKESKAVPTLPHSLLFATQTRSLVQALSEGEIPVLDETSVAQFTQDSERLKSDQVSLMRLDDRVAWVIAQKGKKKIEANQPQLWIEKDTFLPLKLVFMGGKDQQYRQVQFGWVDGGVQKGALVPQTITLLNQDSKAILKTKLLEGAKYAEGSEQVLFRHKAQGFTSEGESASSELKTLIQLYYDSIR